MASPLIPPNGVAVSLVPALHWPERARPCRSRSVLAAARVVAAPPLSGELLDWDATLGIRHRLWSLGFGVAEAMDTAQRGMGLDWVAAKDLIRRSSSEARAVGGRIASGAGTDQLSPPDNALDAVVHAYEEQVSFVEDSGSQVILMASHALARSSRCSADYLEVYDRVLAQVSSPVILHWLGEVFDPALAGYWGSSDLDTASDTVVELIQRHPKKVDGIKVSLLDTAREINLRRRLPDGVKLYTGDDFNYVDLIRGDELGFSHALLGILDGIAAPAAAAFAALDAGDIDGYEQALLPTVPLARHVFVDPTRHYKTGLTFLAWLNGFQPDFVMLGGLESARSAAHLVTLFQLAKEARVLRDPDLAAIRLDQFLATRCGSPDPVATVS